MILMETDRGKVVTESTSKRKVGNLLIRRNLVFILDLTVPIKKYTRSKAQFRVLNSNFEYLEIHNDKT